MATKRCEYIGPERPGVIIRDADGQALRATYGEPIEVDTATANSLLSRDDWREPKPGPKPTPKPNPENTPD